MMAEAELTALVGHRFPGGTYRIANWESWLLTDCTGRDPLPDGLVHPIALFHAPILGAGTSIAELFALAGAAGPGSVGIESYDWEYVVPLHEGVEYRVDGGIVEAERTTDARGRIVDRLAFAFELRDRELLVARVTNRWRLHRGTDGAPQRRPMREDATSRDHAASDAIAGDPIPPWSVPSVDAARMKTMAAILRDPYPVHWDRSGNAALGLDGRVVNQGPLNLGYVVNMLLAWAGPTCVRRLTVGFGRPVLDGEAVTARGRVVGVDDGPDGRLARCEVWLERDGMRVVEGRRSSRSPRVVDVTTRRRRITRGPARPRTGARRAARRAVRRSGRTRAATTATPC